ncbi:MAG TPA: hypothetical protein DCS91_23475 [Microcoleaceae bacterium UBA11344]|nr:hypothetical protein [Microcoleaceae cyanobacterium UBA11344]
MAIEFVNKTESRSGFYQTYRPHFTPKPPQTSAQMLEPLQNLYTAAQYEFFDTTMAPVLWQFYIVVTTTPKS